MFADYRASASASGSTDWDEKALLAAAWLDYQAASRKSQTRLADHVLVDEAQDLSPSRWLLLRALVAAGPNDLFIAEDAQQRIYGHHVVLSRYGIKIAGHSRRLTLIYRTTAQNLFYALGILDGVTWSGLEEGGISTTGVHSARTGPVVREFSAPTLVEEYEQLRQKCRMTKCWSWMKSMMTSALPTWFW